MNITDKIKDTIFDLVDSNVTVWLKIDEKEYEIEQFKTSFAQPSDFKGEPQSETKGGLIMVTLTEALPDSFYEWAIKSKMEKNGEISFRIKTGNSPMKIDFFRATCINFSRDVSNHSGLKTNIVISSERILVNGIEHDNFWKNH